MSWKILEGKFLQNFYYIIYHLANQSHKGHSFKMQDMQYPCKLKAKLGIDEYVSSYAMRKD